MSTKFLEASLEFHDFYRLSRLQEEWQNVKSLIAVFEILPRQVIKHIDALILKSLATWILTDLWTNDKVPMPIK